MWDDEAGIIIRQSTAMRAEEPLASRPLGRSREQDRRRLRLQAKAVQYM